MKKKYAIPSIALAVCAIIAAAWLYHLSRAPLYSLARLVHACDTRDVAEFHKHFDSQAVVASGIDEILDTFFGSQGGPGAPAPFRSGLGDLAKPMLVPRLVAELDAAVAEGRLATGRTRDMNSLSLLLSSSRVTRERGITFVTVTGDTARVGLVTVDPKSGVKADIELGMRRVDGAWRVTEIKNLKVILRQSLEIMGKDAP